MSLIPGIALTVAGLSLNLLGDGLRHALDPRLRVQCLHLRWEAEGGWSRLNRPVMARLPNGSYHSVYCVTYPAASYCSSSTFGTDDNERTLPHRLAPIILMPSRAGAFTLCELNSTPPHISPFVAEQHLHDCRRRR